MEDSMKELLVDVFHTASGQREHWKTLPRQWQSHTDAAWVALSSVNIVVDDLPDACSPKVTL